MNASQQVTPEIVGLTESRAVVQSPYPLRASALYRLRFVTGDLSLTVCGHVRSSHLISGDPRVFESVIDLPIDAADLDRIARDGGTDLPAIRLVDRPVPLEEAV
jgi:hypothetical protein